MSPKDLERAIAQWEAGSMAACFPTLLEAALAGNSMCQNNVGCMLIWGQQRFETFGEWQRWSNTSTVDQWNQFYTDYAAEIEQGVQLLRASADSGNPFASINLAVYYQGENYRLGDQRYAELQIHYADLADEQKKRWK